MSYCWVLIYLQGMLVYAHNVVEMRDYWIATCINATQTVCILASASSDRFSVTLGASLVPFMLVQSKTYIYHETRLNPPLNSISQAPDPRRDM